MPVKAGSEFMQHPHGCSRQQLQCDEENRMAHLLSKIWKFTLLGFVILIISLACLTLTPASPGTSPTSPAGAPSSPAGAPTSPAGELSVSADGNLTFGPGSFNLTEPG